MSYYRIFKPTEEHIKKLTPYIKNGSDIEKNILRFKTTTNIKCLKKVVDENEDRMYEDLRFVLEMMVQQIRQGVYIGIMDELKSDGTITLCGRTYNTNENFETVDEVVNSTVEDLLVSKFVLEVDKLFNDSGYNEISDELFTKKEINKTALDDFVERITTCIWFEVINILLDCEMEDDYTGYEIEEEIEENTEKQL